VQPTHYALAIHTDLSASRFAGEALIDLELKETADKLVFNLNPCLKVTRLAISSAGKRAEIPLDALVGNAESERATVTLPCGLAPGAGAARLFVRWEAPLGENMMGYYRSSGDAREDGTRPR
jgi:aminopeptidase 2